MTNHLLMKAIQLTGIDGLKSLNLTEVKRPSAGANEVLLRVKAAGVNFAELEMIYGRYPSPRPLPAIMGFEAAGEVVEIGAAVENVRVGDRVTAIVNSGGYAEYAVAAASNVIPIPEGISFAEASTITVQGLSAYAILKLAAKPQPNETVLVQAAAGGVGLYLVQLAKMLGPERGDVEADQRLIPVNQLGDVFCWKGVVRVLGAIQIAECVPGLLQLIASGRLKLFANYEFPLEGVAEAFQALASRNTIGKVVLVP